MTENSAFIRLASLASSRLQLKYYSLMFVLHALSRIGALIIGLSLVYVALFFTKADDGRVQNLLLNLWVVVESISTDTRGRVVAFFNQTAALINRLLDEVFGNKLISLRFVSISVILSICSLFLCSAFRIGEHPFGRLWYVGLFLASCLIADVSIGARKATIAAPAAIIALGLVYWNDHFWFPSPLFVLDEFSTFFGIAIGLILDAGFVSIIRMILRKQEEEKELKKLLVATLVSLALGIVLLIPSWPFLSVSRLWGEMRRVHPVGNFIMWTVVISSTTNLFAGLCAFSLLIVSALALYHKILWRMASNLIHVCYERRVIENRILLFTVGSALLSYSTNWFSWLRLIPH